MIKKREEKLSDRNLGTFQKDPAYTTIYIGNLSYRKKERDLEYIFRKFGKVSYVRLILDTVKHTSKGIAFIQMPNKSEAEKAILGLNGKQMDGRTLKVSIAKENSDRPFYAGPETSEDKVSTKAPRPKVEKKRKPAKKKVAAKKVPAKK